jgi:hypothetical protein
VQKLLSAIPSQLPELIGFQGKRTGDTGIRYPQVSCHLPPMICYKTPGASNLAALGMHVI